MQVTVNIPERLLPYIEHIPAGLLSESIINAFEKSILESNAEHILAYENNSMLKEVLALLKGNVPKFSHAAKPADDLVRLMRESLMEQPGEIPTDKLVNISDYYQAEHSGEQDDNMEEDPIEDEPKEIEEVLQNIVGVSSTEQEVSVSIPLDDDLGDLIDLMK